MCYLAHSRANKVIKGENDVNVFNFFVLVLFLFSCRVRVEISQNFISLNEMLLRSPRWDVRNHCRHSTFMDVFKVNSYRTHNLIHFINIENISLPSLQKVTSFISFGYQRKKMPAWSGDINVCHKFINPQTILGFAFSSKTGKSGRWGLWRWAQNFSHSFVYCIWAIGSLQQHSRGT